MNDIVLRGVTKAFGSHTVLQDYTHVFPAGKITCIEGASGCGKTTLLYLLAGLMKPDGGVITGVPERRAFVFQEDRLCEDFTAVSNIRLVCGKSREKAEIMAHLEMLSLGAALKKPVRAYSGGMKRRVAIARAVLADADCLFLDEPFKGLDEALKEQVMDYVLAHTRGKTVICVTHDRSDAAYLGGELTALKGISNEHSDEN